MVEPITVIATPGMATSSPILDSEHLADAPTSPVSTLSSDDRSIITIETVTSTTIKELGARDIALDPEVIAGPSTLTQLFYVNSPHIPFSSSIKRSRRQSLLSESQWRNGTFNHDHY